jgi:hypothetical protein
MVRLLKRNAGGGGVLIRHTSMFSLADLRICLMLAQVPKASCCRSEGCDSPKRIKGL